LKIRMDTNRYSPSFHVKLLYSYFVRIISSSLFSQWRTWKDTLSVL
jgi:hypothetical protein